MSLPHSETRGTRTFHLPLERNSLTPPQMTVVIRPARHIRGDLPIFEAGVSFCASSDQFSKAKGRQVAFGRLLSQDVLQGDSDFIRDSLLEKWTELAERRGIRPNMSHFKVIHDIDACIRQEDLVAYFEAKDKNRAARG